MLIIQNKNVNRIIYLDILRIVSIFSVVMLHVSAPFLISMENNGNGWWWAGNIFDSATRWCVPVLIIISGKLILGQHREEKIVVFLKKKLTRILIPLLSWSLIYFLWNNRLNLRIDASLILEFIINAFEGHISTHLWYLYMLTGLYLITPIVNPFIQESNKSNIKYFIVIWFVANGIFEFFGRLYGVKTGFYLHFFHWSIGYYILGFSLGREDLGKIKKVTIYILGILGLISTFYGTYYLMILNNGIFQDDFYSYLAPNVILMAIGVFILFQSIRWEKFVHSGGLLEKIIQGFNKTSFGIYLIHPLVIDILRNGYMGINIGPMTFNYIIGIPVVSIIVFLLSYIIIWIIQRIPVIRRIV